MIKMAFVKKLIAFAIIFTTAFAYAHAGGGWTGFYAGGNAGYAWGSANNTLSIADDGGVACHFCFASDIASAESGGSSGFSPNGFTGGAQVGYNWQASNLVYGAELDFEAFSQRQSVNSTFNLPASTGSVVACGVAIACVGNLATSVKTDWLITLRPRVGYAFDNTLVYITGGLALTQLSLSQVYSDNINFGAATGGSLSLSSSQTKVGWVIGGGLEHAIGNQWSVKAEYLYTRFDGISADARLVHIFPGGIDGGGFSNNLDHFSSNIVRVGFNYKFGASIP